MIVKAHIEGREYAFAPLKFGQIRTIRESAQAAKLKDGVAAVDFWMPYVQDSYQRGSGGGYPEPLPNIEEMEVQSAQEAFGEMLRAVLEASGYEVPLVGEAVPAATTA